MKPELHGQSIQNANTMKPELHAQIIQNGKKGFSTETPKATNPSSPAAEQAHNRSMFVQAELTSSWPSLATIKKSARSEWTIPSVRARIAEMKLEHRQQLAKLIRYRIQEEEQMHIEQYRTFDELETWIKYDDYDDWMKRFHRMERRLQMHQTEDFISRLRYIHLMALKPLYERLHKLMIVEESAKAQRARLFPKSSQAWREMDTPSAKLKVARFLLMDKKQQDDIVSRELVWRESKVDVDAVVREYQSNVMFSQEVKNYVKENVETVVPQYKPNVMFTQKVKNNVYVKENQTTDPRRRAI